MSEYLLWWLFLGHVCYSFATAIRAGDMESKGKYSTTDYFRGLSMILAGPLLMVLIAYLEGWFKKK